MQARQVRVAKPKIRMGSLPTLSIIPTQLAHLGQHQNEHWEPFREA